MSRLQMRGGRLVWLQGAPMQKATLKGRGEGGFLTWILLGGAILIWLGMRRQAPVSEGPLEPGEVGDYDDPWAEV